MRKQQSFITGRFGYALIALAAIAGDVSAQADDAFERAAATSDDALVEAARGAHRSDEKTARDVWRHPVQTLRWFGLRQDMTVVEIWPGGGGWYTEILAPYLREHGKLYAANYAPVPDTDYYARNARKYREKLAANPEVYDRVEITELMPPADELEAAPAGSADMVLTFRNLHNWERGGYAPAMFDAMYRALKPGGVLGLVAHRADPGTNPDPATGYVTEARAIELAEAAGFELLDRSEINANPRDTKDHPEGVWTLPPSLRLGEKNRAHYAAIGESDRMTLKFRKPE